MKIIITGSRTVGKRYANMPIFQKEKADMERLFVCNELAFLKPSVVIHGDCPTGVDAIAKAWAIATGIVEIGYPAEWNLWGKKAGPIRNCAMLDANLDADYVLAFPRGGGGTEHCVREAKKRGLNVIER